MYTIIKNVPVPNGDKAKWPFREMETGDSIIIDNNEEWGRACSAANAAGRKLQGRFMCRWPRYGKYGQIWRVK